MLETVLIIIVVFVYLFVGYWGSNFIEGKLILLNSLRRISVMSLFYALYFGIGIAFSDGGNPGFAIPAPNWLALALMLFSLSIKTIYKEVIILLIYWVAIFMVMFIYSKLKRIDIKK